MPPKMDPFAYLTVCLFVRKGRSRPLSLFPLSLLSLSLILCLPLSLSLSISGCIDTCSLWLLGRLVPGRGEPEPCAATRPINAETTGAVTEDPEPITMPRRTAQRLEKESAELVAEEITGLPCMHSDKKLLCKMFLTSGYIIHALLGI